MADHTFGPYPGLAIVGGGELAGLYGVDGGLRDAQGIGLQHGFLKDYRHDLIHTATTLLRFSDGTVEYGNRQDDGCHHPIHLKPVRTFSRDGFARGATFEGRARRTEVIWASGPACLTFECTVDGPFEGDVAALVVFRPYPDGACTAVPGSAHWQGPADKQLQVTADADWAFCLADSPSGFLYRTIQTLQAFAAASETVQTGQPIGLVLGRHVTIPAGESVCFKWQLGEPGAQPAPDFWESWFRTVPVAPANPAWVPWYRANLAALRGALMGGFVPADMTGQYFAGGSPSYYARDAMMVARAFLMSGCYAEAESVLRYLAACPVKRGGEFCQRYNAAGEPAEGQDNGVPHQLDSQGYFAWNVVEFQRRTGRWPVPYERVAAALDALADCVGPSGMVGPEGGVNEGVYGPAYITSTNMFVWGGLHAGAEAARQLGRLADADRWDSLAAGIQSGIEATWDESRGRYGYGFVLYADDPVRQYDTPQYFGPLYGYPLTDRVLRSDQALRQHAAFFGGGIGYSEQEYHHGPWIFNTAACAEFQALVENSSEYEAKLGWLMAHSNQYGLMPEAIDGDDESLCFVNPLVWGCAEIVSAIALGSSLSRR